MPIVKYPLDLTGNSPDNLIRDEQHVLLPGKNRSLIPKYGAFYTQNNMGLRDLSTGEILEPETQYKPILYYAAASERAGREVCAGVIVTDPRVSDNVAFTYQVVGGEYTHLTTVILELIENLNLDNREVLWGDLLGKPNFFTPAMHLHDIGDVYGFEYIVEALYKLRDAVLIGDEASHEHIFHLIDALRELVVANNQAGMDFTQQTLDRLINFENTTAQNFSDVSKRITDFQNETAENFIAANRFTQETLDRLIAFEEDTANNFELANNFTQATLDRLKAFEIKTANDFAESDQRFNQFKQETANNFTAANNFTQQTLDRLIAFETKLNQVDNFSRAYYDERYGIRRNSSEAATGSMGYNAHTRQPGYLYGGNVAPSATAATSRLNYDGLFYATRFYGDGNNISNLDGSKVATGTVNNDRLNKASTSQQGIVRLTSELNQTSEVIAATALAVKNVNDNANTRALASRIIAVGNGLVGGGNLNADRTITLGTPSSITESSTNSTTTNSHTHAIDRASVSNAGISQLSNSVNSTSQVLAATALAVKTANDNANTRALSSLVITAGAGLVGGGNLTGNRTVSMGIPSTITANTTNEATSTTHTHAVDSATVLRPGVVQLTSVLNSTSEVLAATALAVKNANDNANTRALSARVITAGVGLVGGGNLTGDRTLSLGTPGTISASSSNSASSNSHTHAVDIASLTVRGIVSLTNSVSDTSQNVAATALAVKTANDNANTRALSARAIATGDGLQGGGNLTGNRTLSVDATVVRTHTDQVIAGIKTFTNKARVLLDTQPGHNYGGGHLELVTSNGSDASLGFHRAGQTAAQLRHSGDGLILSGNTQSAAASFRATGNIAAGGRLEVGTDGLLPRMRERSGRLEAVIGGSWRVIWPPQWQ